MDAERSDLIRFDRKYRWPHHRVWNGAANPTRSKTDVLNPMKNYVLANASIFLECAPLHVSSLLALTTLGLQE